MTKFEREVELLKLAHNVDQIKRGNTRPNEEEVKLLIQLRKELREKAKDFKLQPDLQYTPSIDFTDLTLLTCYIDKSKLLRIFYYYDNRDIAPSFVTIPRSYYNTQPEPPYTVKQVPVALRLNGDISKRGYEMMFTTLAKILGTETSHDFMLRTSQEQKEKRTTYKRPDHDYRPWYNKL